jgi:hypothetical protein
MLISESQVLRPDPILSMLAAVGGRPMVAQELQTGVYEIGHFGSSNFLSDYEDYPELIIDPYGVCDNFQQIIDQCPELLKDDRSFVITVTKIEGKDQDPSGGWRWHKWGEYIGTHEPQCEYIYDEPEIEAVYVYSIYEKH